MVWLMNKWRSLLSSHVNRRETANGRFKADNDKGREELHKQIIEMIVKPCDCENNPQPPIAILVGGGTASGKTYLRKMKIEKKLEDKGIPYCLVDADDIKLKLPEYHHYLQFQPEKATLFVHKESVYIGDLLLKHLINKRYTFIYEGTMARRQKYKELVRSLKRANYDIHVWIADIPLELAIKRAAEREKEIGRKVPLNVIKNTHKLVPRTFLDIKNEVDSYQIYNNEDGFQLIYSNTYLDKKRYPAFLQKGKRT